MEVEDARTASKGCTGRYTSPAVFCCKTLDKILFCRLKLNGTRKGDVVFRESNVYSTAIQLGLIF